MLRPRLLRLSDNPWANGLRLLLLNGALAGFCMVSFVGTLYAVSSFNSFRLARGGSPSAELPFPYLSLLMLYAFLFLIAWFWFGRKLPTAGRARLLTALIGAGALFGLSLLGYLSAVGAFVLSLLEPSQMPVASVFVFGGLSTLVLMAGVTCVSLIVWPGSVARVAK